MVHHFLARLSSLQLTYLPSLRFFSPCSPSPLFLPFLTPSHFFFLLLLFFFFFFFFFLMTGNERRTRQKSETFARTSGKNKGGTCASSFICLAYIHIRSLARTYTLCNEMRRNEELLSTGILSIFLAPIPFILAFFFLFFFPLFLRLISRLGNIFLIVLKRMYLEQVIAFVVIITGEMFNEYVLQFANTRFIM